MKTSTRLENCRYIFTRESDQFSNLFTISFSLAQNLSQHPTMADAYNDLYARAEPENDCTDGTCNIWSIHGYRPSLPVTILFLTIFALSTLAFLIQGLQPRTRYQTWFFTAVMAIGSLSEVLGYISKLPLYEDPFYDLGFNMGSVLLTFAPTCYAAAIYAMLAQICLALAPELSRLHPRLYTRIFITCDMVSIILQAAGGGIASGAPNSRILGIGKNVMLAGLATQLATLLIFGALAADFAFSVYKNRRSLHPATTELRRDWRFEVFVAALYIAYGAILLRCCYRVAELCGEWGSSTMHGVALFVGLDSSPIALAAIVLNSCHPGRCFPVELNWRRERRTKTLGTRPRTADTRPKTSDTRPETAETNPETADSCRKTTFIGLKIVVAAPKS
jgi:hypothetical protein